MRITALVLVLLFLVPAKEGQAIEPISMTLATTIGLPLAMKAIELVFSGTEPKGCKPQCFEGSSRYCAGGILYKNYRDCKGACQKIIQHGDYQIRVRFRKDKEGNEDSLINCVQVGNKASGRDQLGKQKDSRAVALDKSIAVYNSRDLKLLLEDVYQHEALKILSVSDINYLLKKYPNEIGETMSKVAYAGTREAFVKEAKEKAADSMKDIENQIENVRKSGVYGPQ